MCRSGQTIVVLKTHVDVGFTALAEEVTARYARALLPAAVETCESTPDFIWTMPAWALHTALEGCGDAMRERAERLIRARRIVWHALPFTTYTAFLDTETLIRGLGYSGDLSRRYDCWPVSAKMTDVPGHSWMLPTLLHAAGVRFLHLGCNPACMPPDVPFLFWWEGPDGGSVLTAYSKGSYGTALHPPADWPYPVWLALAQTGDNVGPMTAEEADSLLVRARAGGRAARMGTLDDFYQALLPHLGSEVPVIKRELGDSWASHTAGFPKESRMLRSLRPRLRDAGLSMLRLAASGTDPLRQAEKLEEIHRLCLLYGEHTWGGDYKTLLKAPIVHDKAGFLKSWSRPDMQRLNASWKEQSDRALRAEALYREAAFPPDVLDKEAVRPFSDAPQPSVTIEDGCAALETPFARLTVSAQAGGIAQWMDKRSGFRYARPGAPMGGYRYDVMGSEDITEDLRAYGYRLVDWFVQDFGRIGYPLDAVRRTFEPNGFTLERVPSPAGSATVRLQCEQTGERVEEYGDARKLSLTIAVHGDTPAVDVTISLLDKQMTPMIESGHIVFPMAFSRPRVRIQTVGCVEDPAADVARNANNLQYALEHFVDFTEGGHGLLILSPDAHLLSLGENAIYRYRPDYLQKEASAWFTLFYNKHPKWISGDFAYRFRLIPHRADLPMEEVYRLAESYCAPLGDTHPLTLPPTLRLLGVQRLAKGRFAVHVQDVSGRAQEAALSVAAPYRITDRLDLFARRVEPFHGLLPLGPYGVAAVELACDGADLRITVTD